MRIAHNIKWNDYGWEEWVSKHIGEKDKDYFIIVEKFKEYDKDGVTIVYSGSRAFWEIPNEGKAILFSLRFS